MATSTTYPETAQRSAFMPNVLDYIALALTIIGGLNWGLIGAMNFNLVTALFGEGTTLTRIVYILVGLAALYCLSFFGRFPRGR